MPDELGRLGKIRQLFETSGARVVSSVLRGLFPIGLAAGLVASAPQWFPLRDWKYYLIHAAAIGLFLSGARAALQAWRRRKQKIATFEHGFAVWRHGRLSTFDWNQVEVIEASPSFFGFTVVCRTAEGQQKKFSFDTGIDPTEKLRSLWREFEEESSRARIPAIVKTINAGEDAIFVHKTWGKETGTKIAMSRGGICVTPRYGKTEFREWPCIAEVKIEGGHLIITKLEESDPWINEPLLAMPGYVAIQAASNPARQAYYNMVNALFKAIDAGADAVFVHKIAGKEAGIKIAMNGRGIYATCNGETQFREWPRIAEVKREGERLIITELGENCPWIDAPLLAMPSYAALQAVADHARRAYLDSLEDGIVDADAPAE